MLCSGCGRDNDDNAYRCVHCGEILQRGPDSPAGERVRVPNYLAQSILVTVCCCLPLGIPAIVYSAQVNTKLQAGNYQGAVDCSNKAKMWAWIALAVGILFNILYFMFYAMMGFIEGGIG